MAQSAGFDVVMENFREQVGSVHEGLLGGLAHDRADLFAHGAEQEVTRQPDEQEIHQEDADAQAHQA